MSNKIKVHYMKVVFYKDSTAISKKWLMDNLPLLMLHLTLIEILKSHSIQNSHNVYSLHASANTMPPQQRGQRV